MSCCQRHVHIQSSRACCCRSLHKKRTSPMLSFLNLFTIPPWCRGISALLSIGTVIVCPSVRPPSASQEIAHYAFAPYRSSQFGAVLGLLVRVWGGKMWQGSPLSNLPWRLEGTMTKATVAASETPSTEPATGTVSESCLSLSEIHAVKRSVQVRGIHIKGLAETCRQTGFESVGRALFFQRAAIDRWTGIERRSLLSVVVVWADLLACSKIVWTWSAGRLVGIPGHSSIRSIFFCVGMY